MSDPLSEAFKVFVSVLGGRGSVRGDPDYLTRQGVAVDFGAMPVRSQGLLCAPREGDPSYRDGGDSAAKTGIAAFCNSQIDRDMLPRFMPEGATMICRNPDQEEYRYGYSFGDKGASRDQLIQYAAGCWRAKRAELIQRIVVANGWGETGFVNKDFLPPNNMMFLRSCASLADPSYDAIGQFFLSLAIEQQSSGEESNGLIAQAIVCGQLDHFLLAFPRYFDQVHDYWGVPGQRWSGKSQFEIGEALIKTVEVERGRYGPMLGYTDLSRLLRLALAPFATPAQYLQHLADRFNSDPKAFILSLVGGDPRLYANELKDYVKTYISNIVSNAAEAGAIAGSIVRGISQAEWRMENKSPAPHRRRRRVIAVLSAASAWNSSAGR